MNQGSILNYMGKMMAKSIKAHHLKNQFNAIYAERCAKYEKIL